MLNKPILFILLLLTTTYRLYSNEFKDIKIINYKESIAVHGFNSGFTKTISIVGFCNNKSFFIPAELDSNLQSFTDFKLYYKKNSKYKEYKNPNLLETSVPVPFYSSAVLKAIEVDKEQYFLCTFKIHCKHLMLFGYLKLFSLYETEKAQYEIALPKNLSYRYDSLNEDSLQYFHMDFSMRNDSQIIKIDTKPYILDEKSFLKKNAIKYPLIRHIIVPVDKKGNEELCFSEWYLSAIDSFSHLNEASKRTIDSLMNSKPSNVGTIHFFYDFIKSTFKFNSSGIGLGAIIPEDVNDVLKNRIGDCKNLSNLLRVILNYKGFDAKLALTATNDHFCDFNFPSLCAGNHAICIVKTAESQILLDPTDITHQIGQPVQSLQGRTVFIISDEKPYYFMVPILKPEENLYRIKLDLKCSGNNLEGNFKIVTHGFIHNDLKWQYFRSSKFDFQQSLQKLLIDILNTKGIDSVKYDINTDSIQIQGHISYLNKHYKYDNLMYFFIDYIPTLISNHYKQNKIESEEFTGSTLSKKFLMKITLDKAIKNIEFQPLKDNNSIYPLNFNVTKLAENSFCVNYDFQYNKIRINSGDLDILNQIYDTFNSKIHETILIHL